MPHGDRRLIIESLRRSGIEVQVWGKGWERGRISQDDMIGVFNQSHINLNLSNSSPPSNPSVRAIDAATRLLEASCLEPRLREGIARRLARLRQPAAHGQMSGYPDQIKGRNFEVPGSGGFLLTGMAENLNEYFLPGHEVACFSGVDDLASQIRYYLRQTDERNAIACAGYDRTMREHTYAHRFSDIFQRIGLPSPSPGEVLAGRVTCGRVEDIA
jgi:spore maturation protein CgeB